MSARRGQGDHLSSIKRIVVYQCVTIQRVKKSECNGKNVSFRIKRFWFKPPLCYLPVVGLLVHYFTSASFRFPGFKMDLVIATLQGWRQIRKSR